MVADTQTKILRALAKLRGRQLTARERDLLEWSERLAYAVDDVEHGAGVEKVAGELAAALEDFAKREREREPVEVVTRETAARSFSRTGVLSLLCAIKAEEREDVCCFRRDRLPDGVLDFENVGAWVAEQQEREPVVHYLEVDLPPDAPKPIYAPAGGRFAFSPALTVDSARSVRHSVHALSYGTPGDTAARTVPTGSGALEELRVLSESLAGAYQWQTAQAAVFVLTGGVPTVSRLKATRQLRSGPAAFSRITLTVDPATTPREVAAVYAKHRQALLGPRYRPLSEKHLALLAFGAEERANGAPWKAIFAKWNTAHEERSTWKYTSAHLLARDWRVARERVLRPPTW